MWRDEAGRAGSALRRLELAAQVWGWKPHLAQMRFFCCPAQVRVAACGRRWGKTESLGVDIASLALVERDCRQLVVAPTDGQVRLLGNDVLGRLLEAWDWRDGEGRPHELVAGRALMVRQRPSLSIVVTGPNPGPRADPSLSGKGEEKGGQKRNGEEGREEVSIVFRTAGRDGRSLRGLWAHRIVADEASRIPDGVLTEVLLPMLADVGGDYVLASSPAGRRSAYYRLYARGQASVGAADEYGISYAAFQCPTSDNPHLAHAWLEAQREELGEAMYAQEFGAQFVDDFGAVFREEDIGAGIGSWPDVVMEGGQIGCVPLPGRLYTLGIDWGRKLDFTVVAVLDATARPARLVYLQRWQGTGWETQAREVAQIVARFQPWRILADGNSIGDPLAETLQTEIRRAMGTPLPRLAGTPPETGGGRGFGGGGSGGGIGGRMPTVERFMFGAESKTKLIDRLTLGLSARAVQFPAHRVLLSELRAFEYGAAGSSGRPGMGARAGAHDDVVIALALAWWAAPEGEAAPIRERVLLGSQIGLGRRREAE